MDDDIGGVCIVTQPERRNTSKSHAHDLADIIEQLTSVALLTANVAPESSLPTDHEVVEYSTAGAGENIIVEALRFVRNQIRLCLALRKRSEAVILFFGTTSYLLPVLCARLFGKRVLVLPRGDVPLSLRLRWKETLPTALARFFAGAVSILERLSYRLADGVISYTPAMARQLGLDRYEEKLHPHGARFVDTEKFDVRVPFEEREQVVGFVGRLDVEKRIPELVETAKRLSENIQFVFVGDGDYREKLESELAEEINCGAVEVAGWVDREEVPEYLNRLRLLVVPSHPTEGLPTSILESMACGTPAYVTPVSGVPDVVREGETGYLMDEVASEAIAEDIEMILARKGLDGISMSARKLIEREFSFEAAVERYETILRTK